MNTFYTYVYTSHTPHTPLHADIHTDMHTDIHTDIRTDIHTDIHAPAWNELRSAVSAMNHPNTGTSNPISGSACSEKLTALPAVPVM